MRKLLLFLVLFPTMAYAGFVGDSLGRISELEGTAERVRGNSSQPVKPGLDVALGDRVTTNQLAIAKVLVRDKYTVTIRELSTVTFSDNALDLKDGTVRVKYAHYSNQPLPVRTQNAVAAIRGSEGVFEVRGDDLVVTGIDGQIDLCKEVIQQYDQVIASKTCQVSKRRMQVAEWAAYIAWSEQYIRVSDLTWKTYLFQQQYRQCAGQGRICPDNPSVNQSSQTSTSTFQFQTHHSFQHQSPRPYPD